MISPTNHLTKSTIGIRELQATLSAATIAREISSRMAHVAALQKRWDRLRWPRPDPRPRGADMVDLPGGTGGLLVRGYKGKEADRLVTRIDPAWSRWSRNCAARGAISLERRSTPVSDNAVFRQQVLRPD